MNLAKAGVFVIAIAAPWVYVPSSVLSMQGLGWMLSAVCAAVMIGLVQSLPKTGSLTQNSAIGRLGLYDGIALAWLVAAIFNAGIALLQARGLLLEPNNWVAYSPSMEAIGQMRQRNQLASLLAIGILSALYFAGGFRKWGMFWQIQLVCIAVALALLAASMSATASRTGLAQMLLISLGCVLLPQCDRSQRHLAIFTLSSYGLCVVLVPWLQSESELPISSLVQRLQDIGAYSRLTLYQNTLELIAQKPWFGHGWRALAYAHYSTEFSGERFMEMLDNAHNLPLHLAVEFGIPVALGFCALVIWLICKGKPWKETRSDRLLAWGILGVIGIHSMVEYPLWYGPFFMTALICIGILSADAWKKWLFAHAKSKQSAIRLGVRSLGVLLLAGTAFVAFDYHRVSQIYLQPEDRSNWYAADPLGAAKKSVLFQNHAKFAELQITPLSRETAPRVLELSSELVHWSPEPRIIEKLIESAVMMQLDDLAMFHLQRYKVAYPQAYALWAQRNL